MRSLVTHTHTHMYSIYIHAHNQAVTAIRVSWHFSSCIFTQMTRLSNRIHVFVQTPLRLLSLGTKTPALLRLCALQWALLRLSHTWKSGHLPQHPRDAQGDSFNELVESDYKLIWLLEHCMMGRWDAPALPPRQFLSPVYSIYHV